MDKKLLYLVNNFDPMAVNLVPMMRSYTILAALLASPGWLFGNDYLGAEAALKQVQESSGVKGPEKKKSPVEVLGEKIKEFPKITANLSPEEAANQWLTLLNGVLQIPNRMQYSLDYDSRLDPSKVLEVLPPSKSWEALAQAVEKRSNDAQPIRQQALRLLVAALRNDAAASKATFEELKKLAETSKNIEPSERQYLQQMLDYVSGAFELKMGTPEEKLAVFAKSLDDLEKNPAERAGNGITIPDLRRDLDETRVAPLIKRALLMNETVQVEGKLTRRLAARLAFENIADLKTPTWDLIEAIEDIPLYEALAKKFPKDTGSREQRDANNRYLLLLIATDRADDAAKLIRDRVANKDNSVSISASDIEGMKQQGFGQQVYRFLKQFLKDEPSAPLWDSFISVAARENKSQEALQSLQEAIAKPALEGSVREEVESKLVSALLAADEVDAGIKLLRESMKEEATGKADPAAKEESELKKLGVDVNESQLEALKDTNEELPQEKQIKKATLLVNLGKLLERKELVDEGIDAAIAAYEEMPEERASIYVFRDIVRLLVENGRGSQAEGMLVTALKKLSQKTGKNTQYERSDAARSLMTSLTWVYFKAGRSQDIVFLLDESPFWLVQDVSQLENESFGQPLMWMIAKALSDTGRKEEAGKIIRRVVEVRPGFDPAYALLIELGGEDVSALLDKVSVANRFEERPLIWKAQLQYNARRYDEAEKTIRAAIAVDPSDGEQGKGDRMRAYAVLADILEAKIPADKEQAKIMRGAVTAIRTSEDADDWWNAGLLSRAVAKYEEALTHFADAYCIQSRLALRYSELGNAEKAEMHYQRAFELMPESFGRVESHCFGCEGAFKGARAQSIAERVFSQLAIRMPEKAQVFYLLGYLRDQQGDYPEAAKNYRRAVELDPDYLNAWQKLLGVADEVRMPDAERDQAALTIFKLKPKDGSLSGIKNLALLWDTVLEAEASLPKVDKSPLYPLKASAEAASKNPEALRSLEYINRRNATQTSYRSALVQNDLIRNAVQLLQMAATRNW